MVSPNEQQALEPERSAHHRPERRGSVMGPAFCSQGFRSRAVRILVSPPSEPLSIECHVDQVRQSQNKRNPAEIRSHAGQSFFRIFKIFRPLSQSLDARDGFDRLELPRYPCQLPAAPNSTLTKYRARSH